MAEYDFRDPLVLELVHGSHRPCEITVDGMIPNTASPGSQVSILRLDVVCSRDYESWPCQAIRTLRAFDEAQTQEDTTPVTVVIDNRHG